MWLFLFFVKNDVAAKLIAQLSVTAINGPSVASAVVGVPFVQKKI